MSGWMDKRTVFRTLSLTLVIRFSFCGLLQALVYLSCQMKASGSGPQYSYQSSSHAIKDTNVGECCFTPNGSENCDTQTYTCSCWQACESSGAIAEAINRMCKAWLEAPMVGKESSYSHTHSCPSTFVSTMVDMMHYPANYSHPNLNLILNSKPSNHPLKLWGQSEMHTQTNTHIHLAPASRAFKHPSSTVHTPVRSQRPGESQLGAFHSPSRMTDKQPRDNLPEYSGATSCLLKCAWKSSTFRALMLRISGSSPRPGPLYDLVQHTRKSLIPVNIWATVSWVIIDAPTWFDTDSRFFRKLLGMEKWPKTPNKFLNSRCQMFLRLW